MRAMRAMPIKARAHPNVLHPPQHPPQYTLAPSHPMRHPTPHAQPSQPNLPANGKRSPWSAKRRGIAAVLAMMFLILFSSLSVAMAIASRGNITTAATQLHVNRAQSAAETGLGVAKARLSEAAARFLVAQSSIDGAFGEAWWTGNASGIGQVQVLPPKTGRQDLSAPAGLCAALAQVHTLDQNTIAALGVSTPIVGNASANASIAEYMQTFWLFTPAVGIEVAGTGQTMPPLAYSVIYAPLANGTDVRAIVTGYDLSYSRAGSFITRTVMQDFRMNKKVKHAIISSSRVMIGKNVMISGNLGIRYNDVAAINGDPLVTRSDFRGMATTLDAKLAAFWNGLQQYDVDGDNRLRVGHASESLGIPSGTIDYNGDGQPDQAFSDVTGDGYVDEFDIFLKQYDLNGDGRVTLSSALAAGTPAQGSTAEFTADEDLALLIDSSIPDRNRNGVSGYSDTNNNGRWDAGEIFLDFDSAMNSYRDQVLGFRDGFIDKRDQYAKVNGKLTFRTTQAAWTAAQGATATKLRGPIKPGAGESATRFGVADSDLPNISTAVFSSTQSGLQVRADGQSFDRQVCLNLGISLTQLPGYVEIRPATSLLPRMLRVDGDVNLDGLPDNFVTAYFEKTPFNAPSHSDFYYRPVYQNMTFKDVVIPMGLNALFRNCTFVGVTYVRCDTANTHPLWGEYGKMQLSPANSRPAPAIPRTLYGSVLTQTSYPTMLPLTAVPPLQLIEMAATPMDKADIPANQVATTIGYNLLPNPLVIDGRRVVNTKARSNNIRFHDCLFVGSVVSDAPQNYTQVRNKIQFTGSTRFTATHPSSPDDPNLNPQPADMSEISKSSMMLPGMSVDLGTFNSPPGQNLQLKGAIIAGVMDVRGNADIDGALLLTFTPQRGQAPLVDAAGNALGNPADFNTTLGYFGPTDGDSEGLDPNTLPIIGGVRVAGWDTDGDGMADVNADQARPAGSAIVPFNGYGRINVRFDPNMKLPGGIMLPMQMEPLASTYREGKL